MFENRDPKEYLRTHSERFSKQIERPESRQFFSDGFKGSFSEHEEPIHHESEGRSMDLSYQFIDEDLIGRFQKVLNKETIPPLRSTVDNAKTFFSHTPVFLLNELRIEQQSQGGEVKSLDICAELPEKMIVFLNPTLEEKDPTFSSFVTTEMMFLAEDITQLGGLLATLHEVGHKKLDLPNLGRDKLREKKFLTAEEAGAILFDERQAWAYALTKLRPFLSKEEREYTARYIHDYALATYSKTFHQLVLSDFLIKLMRWVEEKMEK